MNIRRTATILGTVAFGAASLLGSGIAHADPNEIASTAHSAQDHLTAQQQEPGIVPANLSSKVSKYGTFLKYDCQESNPGHPYLVYDREGPFSPYTYQTADGKPLGEYWWPFDIMPSASRNMTPGGWKVTGIYGGRADLRHGDVTFYCASTPEGAKQS